MRIQHLLLYLQIYLCLFPDPLSSLSGLWCVPFKVSWESLPVLWLNDSPMCSAGWCLPGLPVLQKFQHLQTTAVLLKSVCYGEAMLHINQKHRTPDYICVVDCKLVTERQPMLEHICMQKWKQEIYLTTALLNLLFTAMTFLLLVAPTTCLYCSFSSMVWL